MSKPTGLFPTKTPGPSKLQIGADWATKKLIPQAAENMGNAVTGVGELVKNPGLLGAGALDFGHQLGAEYSKRNNRSYDPAMAAKLEASAKDIGDKYGSLDKARQTIRERPGQVLNDISMVAPGAGGVLKNSARVAEAAGMAKTASALGSAGNVANTVGNVTNPLFLPGKAVGKVAAKVGPTVAKAAGNAVQSLQSARSGVPKSLLKASYDAGKAGASQADTFKSAQSGQVPPDTVYDTLSRAIDKERLIRIGKALQQKAGLSTDPVDFTKPFTEVQKHAQDLGVDLNSPPTAAESVGRPQAKQAVRDAHDIIHKYMTSADAADQSIIGVDNMKQDLDDLYQTHSSNVAATRVLAPIRKAAWQAIVDTDPEYATVMGDLQKTRQAADDMVRSTGTGPRSTASSSLLKTLRNMSKPGGADMLDTLAQHEPDLPAMLAGSATQDLTRHGQAGGWGRLADVGGAALGYALHAPAAIPVAIADAAASSPRLGGSTNFMAGRVGRAASELKSALQSNPVAQAGGNLAKGVGEVAYKATPAIMPQGHAAADPAAPPQAVPSPADNIDTNHPLTDEQMSVHLQRQAAQHPQATQAAPSTAPKEAASPADTINPSEGLTDEQMSVYLQQQGAQPHADGGRVGYKSGGAVDADHERLVNRLMRMAEHAKKAANASTEPLLKAPDEAIVKALAVAQKAI